MRRGWVDYHLVKALPSGCLLGPYCCGWHISSKAAAVAIIADVPGLAASARQESEHTPDGLFPSLSARVSVGRDRPQHSRGEGRINAISSTMNHILRKKITLSAARHKSSKGCYLAMSFSSKRHDNLHLLKNQLQSYKCLFKTLEKFNFQQLVTRADSSAQQSWDFIWSL